MIRATPPRGKPILEWVCVYCPAHGPADSEAHMRQLTKEHLAACHAPRASRTDERIAWLSNGYGKIEAFDAEWILAELRRTRESLREIQTMAVLKFDAALVAKARHGLGKP